MAKKRSMSVSSFKQQCLKLMDAKKLREQPLIISRRGKPVALVTAPETKMASGHLKGSVKFLKTGWETANFADEWTLR